MKILPGADLIVLGLTGSIAMGKSTVAGHFAAHGCKIWSADDEVHKLYGEPYFIAQLQKHFPEAVDDGGIDRKKLAGRVFNSDKALKTLEKLVHPLIVEREKAFIARCREGRSEGGSRCVVCDIPLLFETGREGDFHAIIVASAPEALQRERVLERAGMEQSKLSAILARQMPDAIKRQRADYVVDTGGSIEDAYLQVAAILRKLAII